MHDFSIKSNRRHQQEGLAVGAGQINQAHRALHQKSHDLIESPGHGELSRQQVLGAVGELAQRHPLPSRGLRCKTNRAIPTHDNEPISAAQRFIKPPRGGIRLALLNHDFVAGRSKRPA
jgi:hypothetical protein